MHNLISSHSLLEKKHCRADALASHLMGLIRNAEIKVGEALPSEKSLAETYQVSRTVVREALIRLKSQGVIISRRGSGSIVVTAEPYKIFQLEDSLSATSFFEFRILIDSEAAAMAAVRHTKDQASRLRKHLKELEVNTREGDKSLPDYRFHLIILEAADNEYLRLISQQLSSRMWSHLYKAKMSPYQEQVHTEHEEIYETIIAREPILAKKASIKHLIASAKRCNLDLDLRYLES